MKLYVYVGAIVKLILIKRNREEKAFCLIVLARKHENTKK